MGSQEKSRAENPFLSILLNIVIPALILSKLSDEDRLGTVNALLFALAFPFIYGLWELIKNKVFSWLALLGVVSTLLTGGIGLLKLPAHYIAIKEASIPLIIGIVVLVSMRTKFPLVKKMIYNDKILNLEKVEAALDLQSSSEAFQNALNRVSYLLASSFFLSSFLNYALAKILLVSEPGTVSFNEELGEMTALSYPVIVIPSMLVLILALWYLVRSIKKYTHLELNDIFHDFS